mmetsp:Transcript_38438/g.118804  ORF Transcript_38438/g.118804 Transcript_38438/m.118804 type:complete len:255 (-) Transcript_38438:1113-1877(-)
MRSASRLTEMSTSATDTRRTVASSRPRAGGSDAAPPVPVVDARLLDRERFDAVSSATDEPLSAYAARPRRRCSLPPEERTSPSWICFQCGTWGMTVSTKPSVASSSSSNRRSGASAGSTASAAVGSSSLSGATALFGAWPAGDVTALYFAMQSVARATSSDVSAWHTATLTLVVFTSLFSRCFRWSTTTLSPKRASAMKPKMAADRTYAASPAGWMPPAMAAGGSAWTILSADMISMVFAAQSHHTTECTSKCR